MMVETIDEWHGRLWDRYDGRLWDRDDMVECETDLINYLSHYLPCHLKTYHLIYHLTIYHVISYTISYTISSTISSTINHLIYHLPSHNLISYHLTTLGSNSQDENHYWKSWNEMTWWIVRWDHEMRC